MGVPKEIREVPRPVNTVVVDSGNDTDLRYAVRERAASGKYVPGRNPAPKNGRVIGHIIDFKYGLGVLVDAEHNPQMMCYALGALDTYDGIYDIKTVKMTIFQPRRENISTFSMRKEELLTWADEVLAPTAALAYEGKGEFKAGEHCQFCKVKATCRKRAEYNMELAAYNFELPAKLEESEIAEILPKIDQLISWANDIKDYALQQALSGVREIGEKEIKLKMHFGGLSSKHPLPSL